MLVGFGRNDMIYNESKSMNNTFKCEHCHKASFSHKYTLRRHMQGCGGERLYQCKFCDYRSKRKDNLKVHVVNVHKMIF